MEEPVKVRQKDPTEEDFKRNRISGANKCADF